MLVEDPNIDITPKMDEGEWEEIGSNEFLKRPYLYSVF